MGQGDGGIGAAAGAGFGGGGGGGIQAWLGAGQCVVVVGAVC